MVEPVTEPEDTAQAEAIRQILIESGVTPEEMREVVRSPRINERYHVFGIEFSRWRLIQIVCAIFAVITIFGFWTIRDEKEARDQQRCELTAEGRDGIRRLLERLITPDTGQPLSPEQEARIAEIQRIALEELPPVEYRDGECVVVTTTEVGDG